VYRAPFSVAGSLPPGCLTGGHVGRHEPEIPCGLTGIPEAGLQAGSGLGAGVSEGRVALECAHVDGLARCGQPIAVVTPRSKAVYEYSGENDAPVGHRDRGVPMEHVATRLRDSIGRGIRPPRVLIGVVRVVWTDANALVRGGLVHEYHDLHMVRGVRESVHLNDRGARILTSLADLEVRIVRRLDGPHAPTRLHHLPEFAEHSVR
jgi:hypothetical protein